MSYNLGICCIAKDESLYLSEWVEYHSNMGVEKFFIYDNGSMTPIRETLPSSKYKNVEIINFPGKCKQMVAYDHCLKNQWRNFEWIAFIDVDEYIVPKCNTDIPAFLKHYQKGGIGAVAINWKVFGSSGLKEIPLGLTSLSFTKCVPSSNPLNDHVKCIVRPYLTVRSIDPHSFKYFDRVSCVNEMEASVNGSTYPHSSAYIQINHYFCKSRNEYASKILRGRADIENGIRDWNEFEVYDKLATETDISIFRHVEKFI